MKQHWIAFVCTESNKFKFMPELIQAFIAWNNHDYRHSLKNAWYSLAGISPSNFQGFLIYLTVALYPRRGDPGEPPHICAMIFSNMFLSIILSKRSKLSSQEAWWWAPGRPYDWSQRKPWRLRTTIDEIVWMIKKIMSNPNPINFSHQKYTKNEAKFTYNNYTNEGQEIWLLHTSNNIPVIQFIPTKTCS